MVGCTYIGMLSGMPSGHWQIYETQNVERYIWSCTLSHYNVQFFIWVFSWSLLLHLMHWHRSVTLEIFATFKLISLLVLKKWITLSCSMYFVVSCDEKKLLKTISRCIFPTHLFLFIIWIACIYSGSYTRLGFSDL